MARAWAISAGEVDFNISNLFCPWLFRPWGFRPWCDEIDCRGPRSAVDALGVIPGEGAGPRVPCAPGAPLSILGAVWGSSMDRGIDDPFHPVLDGGNVVVRIDARVGAGEPLRQRDFVGLFPSVERHVMDADLPVGFSRRKRPAGRRAKSREELRSLGLAAALAGHEVPLQATTIRGKTPAATCWGRFDDNGKTA